MIFLWTVERSASGFPSIRELHDTPNIFSIYIHMSISRWRGGEEELTRTCARFFQHAMGISDYTIGVNDWGVAERSRNTALSFLIDYILIRESNGPYETVARALEIHNTPWYAWTGNDLNRGIYGINGIPIDVWLYLYCTYNNWFIFIT